MPEGHANGCLSAVHRLVLRHASHDDVENPATQDWQVRFSTARAVLPRAKQRKNNCAEFDINLGFVVAHTPRLYWRDSNAFAVHKRPWRGWQCRDGAARKTRNPYSLRSQAHGKSICGRAMKQRHALSSATSPNLGESWRFVMTRCYDSTFWKR